MSEERKLVTALFADLTASTELATRLDPEDLRAVLAPFFSAMTEEIERFGGTVQKYIGDAVVAFFGVPVAHEDDPERAIRAGLAMQRRLGQLNRELAARAGGDLSMRIGINTGEVFAHGGGIDEGLVTGESVNIAARFQTLARPGAVVVGERTRRDATHAFVFRSLGDVEVKGVARPLAAWEVERETAAGSRPSLQVPFVGRRSELDLLRVLFDRTANEGRPNLVTVLGPPGIGKSRLTHEAAASLSARPDPPRVVRGRCLPYGDGLTYWPLAEIMKADAGILDSDVPDVMLDKAKARLDPRFASDDDGMGITASLLSSIGVPVATDPLAGAEPEAARRLITRAWRRYLESIAADRPVVALIEDIHWADDNLLELLETLAARVEAPVLFVVSARAELFERRPGWGGGLSNATTLALAPLSASESTALIEHLVDGHPPPGVVGPILHRSEGNPFFAGELLRMMIEDGTLERRGDGWALARELPSSLPDTVQGVIASRLDLLPAEEKRAIQDAAVVGRIFWDGAVAALGSTRPGDAIDALIDKGLVMARPTSAIEGEREAIFNHILTRDVAYASIPRARLPQAHAAVASWLEAVTAGRREEFAEILAFHFERADDAPRTATYALLAGRRHLRVFSAEDAIRWFDRGLVTADAAGADGVDAATCGELALSRGEATQQLGRFEDARGDFETAVATARAAGLHELEARATAALVHVLWLADRYDEGKRLLPDALGKARAVGPELEARLRYTAGTFEFGRGGFEAAIGFHREALRIAEAAGDLEGQALAHHGLCESYFFHGPFERGLDHGRRADELLRRLGQKPMVAHNGYMVAWLLGFVGEWDAAFATVESSIEGSREIGNRRDEAFALLDRSELLLSDGRLGEAIVDASAGIAIFRELNLPRGELVGLNVANDILGECWLLDEIGANAARALELSDAIGGSFQRRVANAFEGWADLAAGDTQAARARFEPGHDDDAGLLNVLWPARIEAQAYEWAGDAAALDAVAERMEHHPSGGPLWDVWAPVCRAIAAGLRSDWERSVAAATAALGLAEAAHERRAEWRAARAAAAAAEALGRADEAEVLRDRARRVAKAIADGLPPELRSTFTSRPDVVPLLG